MSAQRGIDVGFGEGARCYKRILKMSSSADVRYFKDFFVLPGRYLDQLGKYPTKIAPLIVVGKENTVSRARSNTTFILISNNELCSSYKKYEERI